MKKTLLFVFTLTINSLCFGTVYYQGNQALGYQVHREVANARSTVWGNQDVPGADISLAAGYKLRCVNSLPAIGGSSNWTTEVNQFIYAGAANNHSQSGWSRWAEGSLNQCNLQWQWEINTQSNYSFGVPGISWTPGPGSINASGTFEFYMYKPVEIACWGEGGADDPTCFDEPVSPLVFDMLGDGFTFSDVDVDPVPFDLDNDGKRERSAWTLLQSDDTFLALDRNGNQRIDNGGELFGNVTVLQNGQNARNGYEALKELDQLAFGGTADGILDKSDYLFRKLLLWNDSNHNGYSEEEELWPLKREVNARINLDYGNDPIIDEYGNLLMYFSNAQFKHRGEYRIVETTDVYFRVYDYE